jgi:hypothetical protein
VLTEEALTAYTMLTNGTDPWSKQLFKQLRYKTDGQKVSQFLNVVFTLPANCG